MVRGLTLPTLPINFETVLSDPLRLSSQSTRTSEICRQKEHHRRRLRRIGHNAHPSPDNKDIQAQGSLLY